MNSLFSSEREIYYGYCTTHELSSVEIYFQNCIHFRTIYPKAYSTSICIRQETFCSFLLPLLEFLQVTKKSPRRRQDTVAPIESPFSTTRTVFVFTNRYFKRRFFHCYAVRTVSKRGALHPQQHFSQRQGFYRKMSTI